jgi:nitroreductase
MDTFDALKARTSVRSYDTRPVPDDVLGKVLEMGRIAPSANNAQPWHFVVVKDAKKRKQLSGGRWAGFLKESPVVIVGCGDRNRSPDWHVVDTTIALQQMVVAATAEGLGTCWIGSFDEENVRSVVKVPENYAVVAMLTVGYPKEKFDITKLLARSGKRKAMDEILSREEFGRR